MEYSIKNQFYQIGKDSSKNRLYLKLKGFWKTKTSVARYVDDLVAVCEELQPGFTLLTDLTAFTPPPKEIAPVHEAAQSALLAQGLKCTAEIMQTSLVKLATNKNAKASQMRKMEFTTADEGEKWLDVA